MEHELTWHVAEERDTQNACWDHAFVEGVGNEEFDEGGFCWHRRGRWEVVDSTTVDASETSILAEGMACWVALLRALWDPCRVHVRRCNDMHMLECEVHTCHSDT